MPLSGKVAVVTGSGRRTGRVIARRLAASGAAMTLASRSEEELRETAEEIREGGGTALVVPTDVTSEEDCRSLMERTLDELGRIDYLINAAGVYLTGPLEEYTLENWRRTLDTYLTGPFLCCRAAVDPLKESGGGHIVNISSTLVEMALPGFEAYCAAKGGLEAFSRVLANTLRPHGIKVSVLIPTAINAEGREPDPDRMLEREDVAETIHYLLTLPAHVHVPELSLRTVE